MTPLPEDHRGLVLVNTGPGKGKTTAALGAAVRAAGQGLKVVIIQFIKHQETGEQAALAHVPGVEFLQLGLGMFRNRQPNDADIAKAQDAWQTCLDKADSGRYGLIVLDEICMALHYRLIRLEDVLAFIHDKPPALHLILTGRRCHYTKYKKPRTPQLKRKDRIPHLEVSIIVQLGIKF